VRKLGDTGTHNSELSIHTLGADSWFLNSLVGHQEVAGSNPTALVLCNTR